MGWAVGIVVPICLVLLVRQIHRDMTRNRFL